MKVKKAHLFLFSLFVAGAYVSLAAPAPPGGGMGPACWPPPCVPIDGGVSFLIAAGAVYGGKKIYDLTKKVKQ